MKNKDKEEISSSELDKYTEIKPQEEWLDADSTIGTEPGMEPDSKERPREVWVDEKDA